MRIVLTLVLGAFSAATALAVPTLIIDDLTTDGIDFVTTDGVGLDPLDGEVRRTSSVGTWTVQQATGSFSSLAPNDFILRLDNLSVSSSSSGKLLIALVDGFSSTAYSSSGPSVKPVAPGLFTSVNPSLNEGTTQFFLQTSTMPGAAPMASGVGASLPSTSPFFASFSTVASSAAKTGQFDFNATVAAPLSDYSIAMVAILTATTSGQKFSFDWNTSPVPEPGFYGLLSLALSGLFFFGFRRRTATGESNS